MPTGLQNSPSALGLTRFRTMYTCLWVPPALLFLLSLWGFIGHARGFVFGLRTTSFPTRSLLWMAVFLALMAVGFAGMVWLLDLMMYRDANPAPVDGWPWSS